jgi:SAM-dependent methyltransferase
VRAARAALTDRGYWEQHWRSERKSGDRDHILDALLRRHLPPGPGDYLEVGCAPGASLAYFQRRFGYRVTGVDFVGADLVRATLAEAGVPAGEYRVVEADFLRWECAERFDVVASFGFVEHFADPAAVVRRHARFVRPGGMLVLEVPNLRYFNGLLYALLQPRVLALHNRAAMSPRALAAPLVAGGEFEIVHADYHGLSFLDFDERNPLLARRPWLLRAVRAARRGLAWALPRRPTALLSPYIVVIARRLAHPGERAADPPPGPEPPGAAARPEPAPSRWPR